MTGFSLGASLLLEACWLAGDLESDCGLRDSGRGFMQCSSVWCRPPHSPQVNLAGQLAYM